MLKRTAKLVLQGNVLNTHRRVHIHTSPSLKEKWDLLTAVLIERRPVVHPELNDIEKEFKEYLSAIEFENSLKNDTEIKLEKESKSKQETKLLDDLDVKTIQTTQDFIDACKEEFAKFKPADRTTDADKSNDVRSLKRKLDKHLVLVLNQKVGNKSFYVPPQGKREEGETLRQCADRVLKEKCGTDIKVQMFGNAPCGFYKYKYPKSISSGSSVGAKVFFYFARYSSGQVTEKGADFKWLDKSELQEIIPNTAYKKSMLPILFD